MYDESTLEVKVSRKIYVTIHWMSTLVINYSVTADIIAL